MSTTRLPTPRAIRQKEAMDYLGRQTFEDAVKAGRLKPVCQPSRKMIYYRTTDVLMIDREISEGNYPSKPVTPKNRKGRAA